MPRHDRLSRLALLSLILPVLLLCHCGSEDKVEVVVCNAQQLAGGNYTFNLAGVGDCLKPFEATLKGLIGNIAVVLPGYADLPGNNDVSLTLLGVTITAKATLSGNTLVLTDIDPVQIDELGASVHINSVTLCPVSPTRVDGDLNLDVSYAALGVNCPGVLVKVTGAL